MKIICLSFILFGLSLFSISQTTYSDYQDGKVIFELPSSAKLFKASQGVLEEKDHPFLDPIFDEFGIFEVVQLHPNIKDVKLLRTYEIRFSEIDKIDDLLSRVKQTINVVYVEKKELHRTFLIKSMHLKHGIFLPGMPILLLR